MDLEEQLDQIAAERKIFEAKGLGDLYMLLMTKYVGKDTTQQNEPPAEKPKNNNGNNNNGNGKAKYVMSL